MRNAARKASLYAPAPSVSAKICSRTSPSSARQHGERADPPRAARQPLGGAARGRASRPRLRSLRREPGRPRSASSAARSRSGDGRAAAQLIQDLRDRRASPRAPGSRASRPRRRPASRARSTIARAGLGRPAAAAGRAWRARRGPGRRPARRGRASPPPPTATSAVGVADHVAQARRPPAARRGAAPAPPRAAPAAPDRAAAAPARRWPVQTVDALADARQRRQPRRHRRLDARRQRAQAAAGAQRPVGRDLPVVESRRLGAVEQLAERARRRGGQRRRRATRAGRRPRRPSTGAARERQGDQRRLGHRRVGTVQRLAQARRPIRSASRSSAPRSFLLTARTSSSSRVMMRPVRGLALRAARGCAAAAAAATGRRRDRAGSGGQDRREDQNAARVGHLPESYHPSGIDVFVFQRPAAPSARSRILDRELVVVPALESHPLGQHEVVHLQDFCPG